MSKQRIMFWNFRSLKTSTLTPWHCCCNSETPGVGVWPLPALRGTACWAWSGQTWCTQSPWSWPRTRTCTGTGSWGCSASAAAPSGRTPHIGAVRTHSVFRITRQIHMQQVPLKSWRLSGNAERWDGQTGANQEHRGGSPPYIFMHTVRKSRLLSRNRVDVAPSFRGFECHYLEMA